MTPEVIMNVAAVEDAVGDARQGERVEAAPPPGELTMQQLRRIVAAAATFI